MTSRSLLRIVATLLFASSAHVPFGWLTSSAAGQDKSVKPGVNKQFEDPKPGEFVGRFEKEGRDVFDRRIEILEAMSLKPGTIVADIGAGTGLFTRMFATKVGDEGKVYAVDIAANFIKHVEESATKAGLKNVKGVVCKPDSCELAPASVDVVFICDTYHHFEFPHKTMRSLHAALKPGGQLILIDFERIEGKSSEWTLGHVRAGKEVFSKEVTDAGFKLVEEKKDLLRESYFLRFAKIEAEGTK